MTTFLHPPFTVLDGALATELERHGHDLNDPLWSARMLLDDPTAIQEVHRAYLAAGADIITTATYQATFQGFVKRGLNRTQAADLMLLAVELAVAARDEHAARGGRRALVAASIGPYGAYLANGAEYTGDYPLSEDELVAFHRPRLELLAGSRADLLACETIPSCREARALARLLEVSNRPGWISFSARDGAHISHGEHVADCAAALEPFSAVAAIGINCTAPEHITSLVRALRSATNRPIIVYPNSGERYTAGARLWTGERGNPAVHAEEWVRAGAAVIGGCCRTTPGDIAELARVRETLAPV